MASPSAQGQAITITEVKAIKANVKLALSAKYQMRKVRMANPITTGTKIAEILSAKAWMGAFDPWASSTTRMIWANMVSLPTLVAVNSKLPCLLMVAPMTVLPTFFSTGILSPVSIDSSTEELPLIIMPSTGIFSPGRTTIVSPAMTCSISTSVATPFFITRAVLACRPMSFLIASEVRPLVLASSHLPSVTKVIKKAAVSK